jgi:ElaA protein
VDDLDLAARAFGDLSAREVHEILSLRCRVFVVEQRCPYQDPDEVDLRSIHVCLRERGAAGGAPGRLVGTLRWWEEADGVHVGRVLTAPEVRGRGLGHRLVREALERIGARRVVLHAQDHLRRFYEDHGFSARGDVFLEDGIPHVEMVREPAPAQSR